MVLTRAQKNAILQAQKGNTEAPLAEKQKVSAALATVSSNATTSEKTKPGKIETAIINQPVKEAAPVEQEDTTSQTSLRRSCSIGSSICDVTRYSDGGSYDSDCSISTSNILGDLSDTEFEREARTNQYIYENDKKFLVLGENFCYDANCSLELETIEPNYDSDGFDPVIDFGVAPRRTYFQQHSQNDSLEVGVEHLNEDFGQMSAGELCMDYSNSDDVKTFFYTLTYFS